MLRHGEPGYAAHPWGREGSLAIVSCRSANDVVSAVNLAKSAGVRLVAPGSGYRRGDGEAQGSILVDLRPLNGVRRSHDRRVLSVRAGAVVASVQAAAARSGRGAVTGISARGGMATLLSGDLGFLTARHGWSCDGVLSAEVVTASGRIVRASPEENADLFWAVRGAASDVGIVTAIDVATHAVGKTVLAGEMIWSGARAVRDALRMLRDFEQVCSSDLSFFLTLETARPHGRTGRAGEVALRAIVCHVGARGAAEAELAALRALSSPWRDTVDSITFPRAHEIYDAMVADHGPFSVGDDEIVRALSDEVIDLLLDEAAVLGEQDASTARMLQLSPAHKGINEHRGFGGPLAVRSGGQWDVCAVAMYALPERSASEQAWVAKVCAAVRGSRDGVGSPVAASWAGDLGERRARALFTDTYDALARVKAHWDPTNVFRSNANIIPARRAGRKEGQYEGHPQRTASDTGLTPDVVHGRCELGPSGCVPA
nr:FAD-binding protein [Microbacterium atlanticum]